MPVNIDEFGGVAVEDDPQKDEFGGVLVEDDFKEKPKVFKPEGIKLDPLQQFQMEHGVRDPSRVGEADLITALATGIPRDIGRGLEKASDAANALANVPTRIANRLRGREPGMFGYVEPKTPEDMAEFAAVLQKPIVPLDLLKIAPESEDPAWAAAIKEGYNMLVGIPEFLESPLGFLTMGSSGLGEAASNAIRRGFAGDMMINLFREYPNLRDNWSSMTSQEKGRTLAQFAGTAAFAGLLLKHDINARESAPSAISEKTGLRQAETTRQIAPDIIRLSPEGRPVASLQPKPPMTFPEIGVGGAYSGQVMPPFQPPSGEEPSRVAPAPATAVLPPGVTPPPDVIADRAQRMGLQITMPRGARPGEGPAAKTPPPRGPQPPAPIPITAEPTVRLYTGKGGTEGAGQGGSWFTSNPERAASFGPDVSFVDVPNSVADAARKAGTAGDHILPDEWVRKAQPVKTPIKQKVWEIGEELEADEFGNLLDDPQTRMGNHLSQAAGLGAKSVADLDKFAAIRKAASAEMYRILADAEKMPAGPDRDALVNSQSRIQQKAQLAREAIEAATNTGSWVEGEGTIPLKIGDRPMDWSKNPEVADWLRKNGEANGITLPDELKPKAPVAPKVKGVGIYHEATTPLGDNKVRGRFDVAEAGGIVTSGQQGYDQSLQPRDRSRQASVEQINKIERNMNPWRLAESDTTDLGAPFVNDQNMVLSGNGRVMALRLHYDRARDLYKHWLVQNAAKFGLDPAKIEAMDRPVLIRRVSDYGGMTEAEFARKSNEQQVAGMGEGEKARADAMWLESNPNILDLFNPTEEGDLLWSGNRPFLNAFVNGAGDKESLLTATGYNEKALGTRVKNALLGLILGHEQRGTISTLVESAGELNMTGAVNGVMRSVPRLMKLRGTEYDATAHLGQALTDLITLRRSGQKVEDFLDSKSLFGDEGRSAESDAILMMLAKSKSAKATAETLSRYAKAAEISLKDARGGGLLGENPKTAVELWRIANDNKPTATQENLAPRKPAPPGEPPAIPPSSPVIPKPPGEGHAVPPGQAPPVAPEQKIEAKQQGELLGAEPVKPLFTPEEQERVDELKARIRGKLGRVSAGVDPEYFTLGSELAFHYIKGGVRKFGDFAKHMIRDLGEKAKDYLLSWYRNARILLPEFSNELDSESVAERYYAELYGTPGISGEREIPRPVGGSGAGGGRPGIRISGKELIPVPRDHVRADSYAARSNFRLDEEQVRGINLILDRFLSAPKGSFLLADGTGFGKTAQMLAIADQYIQKFGSPTRKIKVLAITENQQVLKTRFKGDAARMGIDPNSITLATYSGLSKVPKQHWDIVIFDEAHNLKNPDAQKSVKAAHLDYNHAVFGTATPMDKWTGAAYFLAEITGKSEEEIGRDLGYQLVEREDPITKKPYMSAVLLPGSSPATVLANIMSHRDAAIRAGAMLRREYPFFGKVDVERMDMDRTDKNEHDAIVRHIDKLIEASRNPNYRRNLQGQKTLQLGRWAEQVKLQKAVDMAMDHLKKGGQVIIVAETDKSQSFWQPVRDSVKEYRTSKDTGRTREVWVTDGAITKLKKMLAENGITDIADIHDPTANDISSEVQRFQSGKARVALATPKSGGTGIDLDDSVGNAPRLMVALSKNMGGDAFEQLVGRVSRKNTKSPSRVVFLDLEGAFGDERRNKILAKKIATLRAIQGGEDLDVAGGSEPGVKPKETPPDMAGPGTPSSRQGPDTGDQLRQLSDFIRTQSISPRDPIGKRISDAIDLSGRFFRAKDAFTMGLARARAASTALLSSYRSLPPWTNFHAAIGRWTEADSRTAIEVREFQKAITKTVPNKLRREAITNWIQAEGDESVLRERLEKSTGSVRKGYETALTLNEAEKTLARNIQQYFEARLQEGIDAGILKQGVDAYVTQIWKRPTVATMKLWGDLFGDGKLNPNFRFAKKRIFESYFEGEQAGFIPRNKDIGHLIAVYDSAFNRAISARNMIRDLQRGTARDEMPIAMTSGRGVPLPEGEAPTEAVLVKPNYRPKGAVAADGRPYITINHWALRDWKWAASSEQRPLTESEIIDRDRQIEEAGEDGAEIRRINSEFRNLTRGPNVFVQGDMLIHPDHADHLRNILKTSRLRQNPVTGSLLKVGAFAKQTKLSLSPFHTVQEAVHALAHRINPINPRPIDLEMPEQKALVNHGLIVADPSGYEIFTEGMSGGGLIGKVPGLGHLQQAYTEMTFKDYIPRLKMAMALDALARNRRAYAKDIEAGRINDDQLLALTAREANAAFGEQNYRLMARRSATTQDFLRLSLLAPDFLEARFRFVAQALTPYGREQRIALALMGATLYIWARILNKWLDDDYHFDPKHAFSVFYKGKEYRLRTVLGDTQHLLTDPRSFWYNRLSPVTRTVSEYVTSRDDRGIKRNSAEQFADFLAWFKPIPLQRRPGDTLAQSALSASGIPTRNYDRQSELYEILDSWRSKQTDPAIKEGYDRQRQETHVTSAYSPLRMAIKSGNMKSAQAEYEKLLVSKTPKQIDLAMRPYTGGNVNISTGTSTPQRDKPFTGSLKTEAAFIESLSPQQREVYHRAMDEREGYYARFRNMLDRLPEP